MKSKLYYILAVLYILMFGFILYINGLFTGGIPSLSNLVINVAFLVIIGILFLISFASFRKLNQASGALMQAAREMERQYGVSHKNLWPEYRKKTDVFNCPPLNEQFTKYQRIIAAHTGPKGAVLAACPVEEYINEDLLDRIGSAHYNSAISGALTGLGILGTFLGLSLGMSSFSGNDIFTISDNIAPLLDGMKVAFHTSVYGIFFSLVFTFVYRSLMADAYEKLNVFLTSFHEYAAPPVSNGEETVNAILIYQSNTFRQLKTLTEWIQGNAAEQTRGLDRIVQQFIDRMSDSMNVNLGQLGRSLSQACEAQETYAGNFRRLEESTRLLLDTSRTMSDTLNLSLERQRELEKKLSDACDSLNNELYTFHQMRDLYEK